jgi:hypothetical protein
MAMPSRGTKNSTPNSTPQIPHIVPVATSRWVVVTWNLPSGSRLMTTTASGSIAKSAAAC